MLHPAPGRSEVASKVKKRNSMTDQRERNTEKSEMRVMWIMTAVIVLIILGLMGMNMLTHPDWMHGA
jgi:hypothetical protein